MAPKMQKAGKEMMRSSERGMKVAIGKAPPVTAPPVTAPPVKTPPVKISAPSMPTVQKPEVLTK